MSWIILSFVAAILWSTVILVDKFVVENEIEDPLIDVSVNGLGLYGILITAGLLYADISFSIYTALGGVIVGLFYISSILTYYKGIQEEEVSRFTPTISLSTLFVAIISFFLFGEVFSSVTYLGIALAVGGAFLISLEDPLHNLQNLQSKKGFSLGIMVAFLFSLRAVSFKYFSADIEFLNLIFWIGLAGFGTSLFLIIYKRNKMHRCRGASHLGFNGFLAGLGFLLFTKAISIGPVSLASAIVRFQPVLVFLGSIGITKIHPEIISEDLDQATLIQKFSAISLAVAGLLIITLL